MMSKTEAVFQLQNLREHCNSFRAIEGIWEADMEALDLAIKALSESNNKRWRAKRNNGYWYVSDYGTVTVAAECEMCRDDCHYYSHNYFRTKEEAEEYAKVLETEMLLRKFADEHNYKAIDGSNIEEEKWHMSYKYDEHDIVFHVTYIIRDPHLVYFNSLEIAQQAIEEIGKDRLVEYLTYEW